MVLAPAEIFTGSVQCHVASGNLPNTGVTWKWSAVKAGTVSAPARYSLTSWLLTTSRRFIGARSIAADSASWPLGAVAKVL